MNATQTPDAPAAQEVESVIADDSDAAVSSRAEEVAAPETESLSDAANGAAPADAANGPAPADATTNTRAGDPRPARSGGEGSAARQVAPRAFPRADRPGAVPVPQHHHLPGWVRRDFGKARPALADLLGLLHGEERAQLQQRLDEITQAISEGKFSLAWQYPQIIAEGQALYERQRKDQAEAARANRVVDTARRRVTGKLRDAADLLSSEANSRLSRSIRQANELEAIAAVEAEVDAALSTAKSSHTKRRDREIERTRAKILKSTPRAALAEPDQTETWQDVLRRFAEQQAPAGE